jgi:TatD DNase family protein
VIITGEKMDAFVDAHCHIDLYEEPQAIVEQADTQHIYTIAVTNAPSVFSHTAALTAGSKYVRAALGLHPELVHSHGNEIEQFLRYLPETRYVGEVGLDYTTTEEDRRIAQRQILTRIADWVDQSGDKVLTVHSRRAAPDVIALLSGIKARVILHWFTGTRRELDDAAGRGFFFSVNSAMLRSEKGRALIVRMPRERVLTETDGPFVRDGDRPAAPPTVRTTVASLADLWRTTPEDVQAGVLGNLRQILTC